MSVVHTDIHRFIVSKNLNYNDLLVSFFSYQYKMLELVEQMKQIFRSDINIFLGPNGDVVTL